MENKHILFGICDSFRSHAAVLKQSTALRERNDATVVVSENVYTYSIRFFDRNVPLGRVRDVTEHDIIHTVVEAEKVRPANAYDTTVTTSMTVTVTAKMAHGTYDHPATLFAKAMIRNQRSIILGIATNDDLGISGVNIFFLISVKHFYIIPSRQDAPFSKKRSIVSDWEPMEQTIDQALNNRQLQPILLGDR